MNGMNDFSRLLKILDSVLEVVGIGLIKTLLKCHILQDMPFLTFI